MNVYDVPPLQGLMCGEFLLRRALPYAILFSPFRAIYMINYQYDKVSKCKEVAPKVAKNRLSSAYYSLSLYDSRSKPEGLDDYYRPST